MNMRLQKMVLYILCLVIVSALEFNCRAKSCPAYGDDTPDRGALFKGKKKNKAAGGLFTKKQRRY